MPSMVAIVSMVIAVGCGTPTGSPRVSATPNATATETATATAAATGVPATPITHETGSSDVVLRVASGGGLLPTEKRLTEMPTVSIYGDGRVIRVLDGGGGPTDPLMPHLVESRLTPAGLTLVLGSAAEAGLLGPDRRLGLEGVYDLWMVTFTLTANGATHTARAYGLGFSEESRFAPPDEMPDRTVLGRLLTRVQDLRGWLGPAGVGEDTVYRPLRMRVYVAPDLGPPTEADSTPTTTTPRAGQDVRRWPFDVTPDVFGTIVDERQGSWRCARVEAEGAELLGVDRATNDTRWQAGNRLYRVLVRPLLPDETGCPG